MTILALPAIPSIASLDWDLERNVAKLDNPLGRTVRRVIRSGDRWRAQLRFPLYNDNDAGVLTAFLARLSRGDNHFWLSPPQNFARGNWSPPELVTNGTLLSEVTTGWTGTNATLSINARRLRVLNTSGAANGQASQNVGGGALSVAAPYWAQADFALGTIAGMSLDFYSGASFLVNGSAINTTVDGRVGGVALPTTGTGTYFFNNTGALGTGKYGQGFGASVARCLLVNGASQVGNILNVDGGPVSTLAAIRAGEFVSIAPATFSPTFTYLPQLVRLTEDLDIDSTGAGRMVFEPNLRVSPADNAAVVVRNPFSRFMVDEHLARESVSAPSFRGLVIDAIEDLTP
jgi:hypothetical protein